MKFQIEQIFSSPGKGNIDLQQKDLNGKGEYFVNSGKTNLDIKGKTDKKAKIFPANTITIVFSETLIIEILGINWLHIIMFFHLITV